jgi:PPOX class probable F420-dependent enzyme
MNRRKLIELTPEERRAYVPAAQTIHLCSHGKDGYPHIVPMWFAADGDRTVWMTTYRKSQKVMNLRRDPRVALLVESGVTYDTLRGVMIRGDAEIIDDADTVVQVLKRIHQKTSGSFPEGIDDALRAQAAKRVAIKVTARRVSSWDHAKLGGVY